MKRSMGINAENAARARERVRQALDFVAKQTEGSFYLAGGRFSSADLTVASLLMPTVDVAALGGPVTAATGPELAWQARWALRQQ